MNCEQCCRLIKDVLRRGDGVEMLLHLQENERCMKRYYTFVYDRLKHDSNNFKQQQKFQVISLSMAILRNWTYPLNEQQFQLDNTTTIFKIFIQECLQKPFWPWKIQMFYLLLPQLIYRDQDIHQFLKEYFDTQILNTKLQKVMEFSHYLFKFSQQMFEEYCWKAVEKQYLLKHCLYLLYLGKTALKYCSHLVKKDVKSQNQLYQQLMIIQYRQTFLLVGSENYCFRDKYTKQKIKEFIQLQKCLDQLQYNNRPQQSSKIIAIMYKTFFFLNFSPLLHSASPIFYHCLKFIKRNQKILMEINPHIRILINEMTPVLIQLMSLQRIQNIVDVRLKKRKVIKYLKISSVFFYMMSNLDELKKSKYKVRIQERIANRIEIFLREIQERISVEQNKGNDADLLVIKSYCFQIYYKYCYTFDKTNIRVFIKIYQKMDQLIKPYRIGKHFMFMSKAICLAISHIHQQFLSNMFNQNDEDQKMFIVMSQEDLRKLTNSYINIQLQKIYKNFFIKSYRKNTSITKVLLKQSEERLLQQQRQFMINNFKQYMKEHPIFAALNFYYYHTMWKECKVFLGLMHKKLKQVMKLKYQGYEYLIQWMHQLNKFLATVNYEVKPLRKKYKDRQCLYKFKKHSMADNQQYFKIRQKQFKNNTSKSNQNDLKLNALKNKLAKWRNNSKKQFQDLKIKQMQLFNTYRGR